MEGEKMARSYLLKLYVVGQTKSSQKAIADLSRILKEELKDLYELKIIDVLENPQLAEDDKILATPSVVRALPSPVRKIIGDLSDKEKILVGLDLV